MFGWRPFPFDRRSAADIFRSENLGEKIQRQVLKNSVTSCHWVPNLVNKHLDQVGSNTQYGFQIFMWRVFSKKFKGSRLCILQATCPTKMSPLTRCTALPRTSEEVENCGVQKIVRKKSGWLMSIQYDIAEILKPPKRLCGWPSTKSTWLSSTKVHAAFLWDDLARWNLRSS